VASVWVRERQHTEKTLSQVMAEFRERFNKSPPQRATLLDWKKKKKLAFPLGSVKDRSRNGRKTAIRKTQLNSVAATNHLCTILDTVAKLPFYIVLRAVLC
jgi:transcription-repair coupling factor (superfamily II helicase)